MGYQPRERIGGMSAAGSLTRIGATETMTVSMTIAAHTVVDGNMGISTAGKGIRDLVKGIQRIPFPLKIRRRVGLLQKIINLHKNNPVMF